MEAPANEQEGLGRSVARSVCLGAAAGAAIGSAECAKLLIDGAPRYADLAFRSTWLGVGAYAALGALLGVFAALIVALLWRRPSHPTARVSHCAGAGVLLGLGAFATTPQIGAALLLPAVAAASVLALSLRELLGHCTRLVAARTWLAAAGAFLAIGGGMYAVNGGASAAPTAAARKTPADPKRPNVLLVTIDTLRPDHLGCYGAIDAHTPTIDGLAQRSILFRDATTQANTTGPSHTTMLTGLYPHDHGARSNGVPIAHAVDTLPQWLAREGYQTSAVVSGFTLKQEACGLAPRFDRYDDSLLAWTWMPEAATRLRLFRVAIQLCNARGQGPMRADRPAAEVVDTALDWLAHRDEAKPFFLWTHFYDPHCPYQPPAPFDALHDPDFQGERARNWYKLDTRERRALVAEPSEVAHMRALYRGEISYTDRELGRLLSSLEASGDLGDTLIVLTSDHGEGLGEHGYWFDHGTFLYDTELAVPLLLRLPGDREAGRSVATQVRLLDLAPTVLEAVGLPTPEDLSGISLLSTLTETTPTPRPSFAQGELAGELSGYDLDGRKLSLRGLGHKWIWTSSHWYDSVEVPESLELYDLGVDPLESKDLAKPNGQTQAVAPAIDAMREHLNTWRELTESRAGRAKLTDEVRTQLRNLGYL